MADINKCIFTGRIGNDVELRTTASGTSVCSLRLAVERPKAKGAEKAESDWLNVIAWRQQAEFVSRYLGKGRKVVVECEVRNRQWTDKQGNQRVSTEFNVVNIIPADSKPQAQQGSRAPQNASGYASSMEDFTAIGNEDDLPF